MKDSRTRILERVSGLVAIAACIAVGLLIVVFDGLEPVSSNIGPAFLIYLAAGLCTLLALLGLLGVFFRGARVALAIQMTLMFVVFPAYITIDEWGTTRQVDRANAACVDANLPDRTLELAELECGTSTCVARSTHGLVSMWSIQEAKSGGGFQPVPAAFTAPWLGETTDVVDVDAGKAGVCAVDASGQVWCLQGGLGLFRVTGVSDAVEVSVGWNHVCARHRDGTVSCWGEIEHKPRKPTLVEGLEDVTALSSGWNFDCAIRDDAVWCWGTNGRGELGGPSPSTFSPPQEVPGTQGAVEISSHLSTTWARLDDGRVIRWGHNNTGDVPSLAGVVALAPPCGIRTDKTVICAADYMAVEGQVDALAIDAMSVCRSDGSDVFCRVTPDADWALIPGVPLRESTPYQGRWSRPLPFCRG